VSMVFKVNTSPFAGREGKFVTSRNLKDRLDRELERNLALKVEPGETSDQFVVSGRGTLHLGVLIENMRRENFEFEIGAPKVRPTAPCPLPCEHRQCSLPPAWCAQSMLPIAASAVHLLFCIALVDRIEGGPSHLHQHSCAPT
jgi:hypothetical protein